MSNPLFTLPKMAQEQISKLLVDNNNAIGLKIGLSTKGCAGLSYTMEYVSESEIQGCELVNDYKFPLFIDNKDSKIASSKSIILFFDEQISIEYSPLT